MEIQSAETADAKPTSKNTLQLAIIGGDDKGGVPVTGLQIGQMCHNHVLANVYISMDETGHVTSVDFQDIGSS